MGKIVVCGAGIIGLSVATMLAQDGHQVTVLKADSDSPPATPADAWASWHRKGVAQFRQPHNLFARFRQICEQEMPGLTERLVAAGCVWVNHLDALPPAVSDRAARPGDEKLWFVTGRRPVVESVIAAVAEDTPGVSVRRGVRVLELLAGTSAMTGTPHVGGVLTATGEKCCNAPASRNGSTRWPTVLRCGYRDLTANSYSDCSAGELSGPVTRNRCIDTA